ncbi:MAG: hypothetical protein ACON4Z_06015 [Planctomycetota bacterium]
MRLIPPRHHPRSQLSRQRQYHGNEVDWAADDLRLRLLNIDHTGVEGSIVELRLSDIQARRGAR